MTAKFVSVENFAIRAGLGDVDNLDDSITAKAQASIEAATVHLTVQLRTEFDQATITDRYYVDTGEFPFVGEFPRFYLSQGFVSTPVASIVMGVASTLDELAGADTVDPVYMVLDQPKGTLLVTGSDVTNISIPTPALSNRYFADITYTAGYAEAADAFGSIYVGAPNYLQEAAITLAKSIFDTGQPCLDSERAASGCCSSIEALIARYVRFIPSALKPMS